MCKTRNTLLLAALLSVAMLPACNKGGGSTSSANPAAAKTDGKEVAVVNGTPISKEMFDAYSKQRAASQPNAGTPDDQKAALDEVVSREVIYQDALKGGLDKNPDVQAEIENLKRNIIANAAIRHHLEVNEPTDAVMKKEYEEKMGNMKSKEYKAKHILVKTETEAKDIIAQLDKGGDFAKLAAEKSVDTASGKDGGELGWFDGSQMVKPFADAAAAMEKGKYSKTPVQSQFGWHVILLEDSRELAPPEFDKVKENVRGIIKNKQLKEYLEGLKSKAK
ncbi:MAG TPA: peptidylprolyl isomerase, partial [Gammaproteobacteria bacterium]|nr:peptidylprolyl isomerase [Gammaproteobacteria bacterium]